MDVPRTAAAFPGATDITQIAPDQYQGKVTVKLGPLTMVFAGKLEVTARDDSARTAAIKAQWREVKGRGNVVTVTHFALLPHERGSEARLSTDMQLVGQVAQYGRAAGVLQALSSELIKQFALRLSESLVTGVAPAPAKAISGLALATSALLKTTTKTIT
jgi:carbon monoxide dehydrogenase subunit G